MTTSPEVVQARRRRPFAWELRCTNLQLRRRFSSLAGYYGDYSLAALDEIHLDEIQHQRLLARCVIVNQPRRSALRARERLRAMRATCERRSSRASPSLANFYATIGRRYVAILLGRRKAKWSRCSPRISVSLPHLHAVARQLRRPSPEASSIADAALWRPHSSIPIADILTIASCDGLVQQPNGIITSEVEATHRLRRRSIVTSDDCIAIKTDVILVLCSSQVPLPSVPPSFHSKSNNATQAGPTPAMATVIRAVAAFSVRGMGSSWTPT